ncbi:hypothetical protein [Brachybacterium hainanense]|uniref:Glycerophosphoryl diester phosphodiesterase membrane domain-containing protein n=1 Tax=Brachybacterium hainanense TaxID=1541174 RepID=A0ABV6RG34_9MICO
MSSASQPPQFGQPEQPPQYGQAPAGDPYSQPAPQAQPSPYAAQASPHAAGPSAASADPFAQPAQQTFAPQGVPPQAGPPRAAPGTSLGDDIGAGFGFAWNTLRTNVAAILVPGVVYGVLMMVIVGIAIFSMIGIMVAGMSSIDGTGDADGAVAAGAMLGAYAAFFGILLLMVPVNLLWASGAYRVGGSVLELRKPTVGQGFVGPGRVILTLLLVSVGVLVGSVLFYIPGLLFALFSIFAPAAAARGASPMDAIKESFRLVKDNIGAAIVGYLVLMAISYVGGMLVVTLVVSIPLGFLFTLGLYERLSRRELPNPELAR